MRLKRLLSTLWDLCFSNGWGFIVPYLLLYELGCRVPLRTQAVASCFEILHALLLALWVSQLSQRVDLRRSLRSYDLAFWVAVVAITLLPGAYLEFPSDPWGHVQRIFQWRSAPTLLDHPTFYKFAYFWNWTWLKDLPIAHRRVGLAVISSFWQTLTVFHFIRLFLSLRMSPGMAKLQALAAMFLMGTVVFSFRYYALSSTPLAYVAYLALLRIALLRDFKRGAVASLLLLHICVSNHRQTVLFLLCSLGALIGLQVARRIQRSPYRKAIGGSLVAAVLGLGGWAALHPARYVDTVLYLPFWGRVVGTTYPYEMFSGSISRFSMLPVWRTSFPFFEAIGLHGFFGAACALALWRTYAQISVLSLCPLFLFLYPPFVLLASALAGPHNLYRLAFAFPLSVAAILGLDRLLGTTSLPRMKSLWVGVVALLILMPSSAPWRNRTRFQFYRVPDPLSLRGLDPTAEWIAQHRPQFSWCRVLSDDVTEFVVGAHLGWRTYSGRTDRELAKIFASESTLQAFLKDQHPCAILALRPDRVPFSTADSWVGRSSRHWFADQADLRRAAGPLPALAEPLLKQGWTRTEVPPFYWLYEPPLPP